VGQPLRRSDAGLDPGGGVASTWSIPAGLVGLPEAVHQRAALDCRGPAHRVDPVVRVGQPRPEIQFVPQHIAGLPLPVQHQVPGTGGLGPHQLAAKETQTARSRTTEYGANYPKVSQAIWTAIQASITGTSSVSSALQTAQGTISGVQQVSGG
jgi:hypothetical protein